MSNYAEARKHLSRALEYRARGQLSQAGQELQTALSLDPSLSEDGVVKGLIAILTGTEGADDPAAFRQDTPYIPTPPGAQPLPPMFAPAMHSAAMQSERPGCITAYVVLYGFFSVVAVAVSAFTMLYPLSPENSFEIEAAQLEPMNALIFALLTLLGLILMYLYLRGLWRMNRWARWIAIILHSLALVVSLSSIAAAAQTGSYTSPITGIGVSVLILGWFIGNGDRFS